MQFHEVEPLLSCAREYVSYSLAICPFHDDTHESLLVFKEGGFYCLACNKKGTLQELYDKLQGWTSPVITQRRSGGSPTIVPDGLYAQEQMVQDAHLFLVQHNDPLGGYLERRMVHSRIFPNHIGYMDGWYVFPQHIKDGKLLGLVLRAGEHKQEHTGMRYYIPMGQPPLLYIPDYDIIESKGYLVVVYGIIDALSLAVLDIPVATSTSGMLSMKAELLTEYRLPIKVLPDKGEMRVGRELVDSLGWRGKLLDIDYPDECKDPNDLLVGGRGEWIKDIIESEE